jgi:hypothetical protein
MWDITAPTLKLCLDNYGPGDRPVVSHISPKGGEIWDTRSFVFGTEFSGTGSERHNF